MAQATFDQFLRLGAMVKDGSLDREKVQAIIEGRVEVIEKPSEQTSVTPYCGGVLSDETRGLITVPDMMASELIALAKKELKLTYLDGDLAKWDFITDERGKSYEVQVWKPGREVVPATEVREHFKDGFVGNTAAFVAWVTKHNPEGYHASIPEDARLFQDGSGLYAPDFFRDESYRELDLYYGVRRRWSGHWCFVAFREFKSA